jgi:DNA invertase Pin-like site-specific DNA recombinase
LYPSAILIEEVGSGVKDRPKLNELLSKLGEGDELIVYAIDRLGRSMMDLVNLFATISSKGVVLISTREGILDKRNPMSNFVFSIMGALAQMERDILKERIHAGLERAKSQGKKLGRRFTYSEETRLKAIRLRQEGLSYQKVADTLGISVGAVRGYERGINT